ncbi:MAG TPA: DUF5597 domain-containing protein [Armatimonadota bacterium]|jgi:hypothetical protein
MSNSSLPHLQRNGQAVQLMVDEQAFLMLAGELGNSSSACAADMPEMFDRLAALHLNTVIAAVTWELVEPEEGTYDFSLVEALIATARERGMRLVLLWFGAWKNGKSCYVPAWVKQDLARFPRVQSEAGANMDIISPFHPAITEADARAFAALMQWIGANDPAYTVVMMQVENEVGILSAPRDFSPAAEEAFRQPVPAGLTDYLQAHDEQLLPEVGEPWAGHGRVGGQPWAETFGKDAAEFFMAWHLASHLDAVAAAGRREHNLPMYANAWLVSEGQPSAGDYPSGGPVSRVMDIWRAAAPHLDLLAPDIYDPRFKEVCASYARGGNPLFIPEAYREARAAGAVFYAFGQHAALGFGPFAIDLREAGDPLGESYAVLAELMPLLTAAQAEGRVLGFYQQDESDQVATTLGGLKVYANTLAPSSEVAVAGGGLLISLGDDEFLAVGRNYQIGFGTPDSTGSNLELVSVDQGEIRGGAWVHHRRLNGDETVHGQVIPLGAVFLSGLRGGVYCMRVKVNRAAGPVAFASSWVFPGEG